MERKAVEIESNITDPRFYFVRITNLTMHQDSKFGSQKALLKLYLGSKLSQTVYKLDDFKHESKRKQIEKEAHIFKYEAEEFLNVYLQPTYDKNKQHQIAMGIKENIKVKKKNVNQPKGSKGVVHGFLSNIFQKVEAVTQIFNFDDNDIVDTKQINQNIQQKNGHFHSNEAINKTSGFNQDHQITKNKGKKDQHKSPFSGYCRILLPPLMQYPHICHQITAKLITFESGTKISSNVIATLTLHIFYRLDFYGFIDIIPIKAFLKNNVSSIGEMRPFVELQLDSCKDKWRSLEGAGIHAYWSGHFHAKKEKLQDSKSRCKVTNAQNNIQINDGIVEDREKDQDQQQDDQKKELKTFTGKDSRATNKKRINKEEAQRIEELRLRHREKKHQKNMPEKQKFLKGQRQPKGSKINNTNILSETKQQQKKREKLTYFDIKRFPLVSAGSILTIRVCSMPLIGKQAEQAGSVTIRMSNAGFFKHPQRRLSKKSPEQTQGYILDHPYAKWQEEEEEEENIFDYKNLLLFHTSKQGETKQVGDITFLVRFIFDTDNVTNSGPFEMQMPPSFVEKEKKEIGVKEKL